MKKKLPFKIGDKIKIISGFYKEKEGEIIKLIPSSGKVIIKGINFSGT